MLTSVSWVGGLIAVGIAALAGAFAGMGDDAAVGWIVALIFLLYLIRESGRLDDARRELDLARRTLIALKHEIEQDSTYFHHRGYGL